MLNSSDIIKNYVDTEASGILNYPLRFDIATMMNFMLFVLIFAVVQSEEKNGSCKDMLQGYLTGQLSSALGVYQVEALRREFKSFTGVIEKSMKAFEKNVETKLRNVKNTSNGSAVYTRWGKKSCPKSAELVLSGYVGGSHYTHTGAAVDALYLPRNPEWGNYRDVTDGAKAYIYGAEYETNGLFGKWTGLFEHDVPCAVCLVRSRPVVKMFPGRKTCDNGWKLEYHGYLMAGHHNHNAGTTYMCVTSDPESLQVELFKNSRTDTTALGKSGQQLTLTIKKFVDKENGDKV
uniref:Short-chain collagen C4-like n=1 Tax=Magallana gigas TaxID=29159 RepID=A0A8W8IG06_MAGGI